MDELTIKSASGIGYLRFHSPLPFDTTKAIDYFSVDLADVNLSASTKVYAYNCQGLADVFDQVAREWKGWTGTKEWSSVEGDFQLGCTTDGLGHIFIRITLTNGPYPNNWRVQATVEVEVAQLDEITKRVRGFVRT